MWRVNVHIQRVKELDPVLCEVTRLWSVYVGYMNVRLANAKIGRDDSAVLVSVPTRKAYVRLIYQKSDAVASVIGLIRVKDST